LTSFTSRINGEQMEQPMPNNTGALAGIKILDLSRVLADASLFARAIAWLSSIATLIFSGYLYTYGWIGMKLWE
jgi:hypothetical protein